MTTSHRSGHRATKVDNGIYDYRGHRLLRWNTIDKSIAEYGPLWLGLRFLEEFGCWDFAGAHRTLSDAKRAIDRRLATDPSEADPVPPNERSREERDSLWHCEGLVGRFHACDHWLISVATPELRQLGHPRLMAIRSASLNAGDVEFRDPLFGTLNRLPAMEVRCISPLRGKEEIATAMTAIDQQEQWIDKCRAYPKTSFAECDQAQRVYEKTLARLGL